MSANGSHCGVILQIDPKTHRVIKHLWRNTAMRGLDVLVKVKGAVGWGCCRSLLISEAILILVYLMPNACDQHITGVGWQFIL